MPRRVFEMEPKKVRYLGTLKIILANKHGAASKSPGIRSQDLDRRRKNVAGTAFRPDELRLAGIGPELAAQAQNLDVDAAIEHGFDRDQ
jgi:hypothetical protein